MTEELRKSINRIRELTPSLNQATNDAMRIVEAVEQFLNEECSVGVPAEVAFHGGDVVSSDDGPVDEQFTLVYERIDGRYRIGVAICYYNCDDEGERESLRKRDVTPWGSCDRAMKFASFRKLPTLLETIAKDVERAMARVVETADAAREVLQALELPARGFAAPHPPTSNHGGFVNSDSIPNRRRSIKLDPNPAVHVKGS